MVTWPLNHNVFLNNAVGLESLFHADKTMASGVKMLCSLQQHLIIRQVILRNRLFTVQAASYAAKKTAGKGIG